jgi:hypothetical protein
LTKQVTGRDILWADGHQIAKILTDMLNRIDRLEATLATYLHGVSSAPTASRNEALKILHEVE